MVSLVFHRLFFCFETIQMSERSSADHRVCKYTQSRLYVRPMATTVKPFSNLSNCCAYISLNSNSSFYNIFVYLCVFLYIHLFGTHKHRYKSGNDDDGDDNAIYFIRFFPAFSPLNEGTN